MAKILVSGYYGFGNLGDEALLMGLVTALKKHHHSVTVLSKQPDASEKMHSTSAQHRLFGVLPALLSHDVLISGGGGLLQDKTSQRSLDYYLMLIRLAQLMRKKVIVYGQSIGPLSAKGREKVAKALANTSIAMRDTRSVGLCHKLGLPATLVADPALLIPKGTAKRSLQRQVILIPRAGYPEITDALSQVGRELLDKGYQLACLAIHPEQDMNEQNKLKEALPKCELLNVSNPFDIVQYLQQAHYVLSARLHGLILAAVAEVPFAGLVYDPKVRAFCEEVGATAYKPPYDTAALLDDVITIKTADEEKLKMMVQRAEQGLVWLEETIKTT